jgi:multidrug efflux pump subunit AcrB
MMKFFIERTFLVNVITAVLCIFGIYTYTNMKRDLIPPLSWPYISVEARLPGATTSEVERLVTFPIEEALKGLGDTKSMWSESSPGHMEIWLEYRAEQQADLDMIQNQVKDRIASVRHLPPDDLKPVDVAVDKIRDIFLANYALENYDSKNTIHRASLLKIQSQLQQVPGVAKVNADHDDRNLFVRIQPEKLAQYGISIPQVRMTLAQYLDFQPLGQIRWNGTNIGVQIESQDLNIETIGNIPLVSNRTGQSVKIKDIANIEWDSWEKQQKWLWNGKEIAELEVRKDIPSDSIDLHEDVQKKVESLKKDLPSPLQLTQSFDGPRFIRKQIESITANGWSGFIMVFLILGIFLGFRSSLTTSMGIPLSYFGAFIALSWLGMSIDLLSILGLIIVVGILVDDAIIMTDRYFELLYKGLMPKEAAYIAAKELIVPVTGTILTTIVAFIPILTIPSNLTWFLQAIPLVVIFTLVISWFETFFILPNHLAHFVKKPEVPIGHDFMEKMRLQFAKLLGFILHYRMSFLAIVILFCGSSAYIAATKTEQAFNISIGSEQIIIYADLKESKSLDDTIEKLRPVMNYVGTIDKEIAEYTSTKVGSYRRDGESKEGFKYAQITIGINGNHPRPVELRKELLPKIAKALEKLKTSEFALLTSEERKRGEENYNKNTLSVHVYGQDENEFKRIEAAIKTSIAKIPNITPKLIEENKVMDVWSFEPDIGQLARYEITRNELASQIREHISAFEVGQTRIGGENISLLTQVKYPENIKYDALDAIPIMSRANEKIPLSWLGVWTTSKLPRAITHEKGIRYAEVQFKYDDKKYTIETAKAALNKNVTALQKDFPSFDIKIENANKRDEENKKWILKVAFYSLLGVATVLVIVLGSLTQPFLVMASVPIGILGALFMIYVHDMTLTIMAIIGLMGVIGVAVNDSIVLTHYYNQLRKSTTHLSPKELVLEAASSRLRAIFLTSLTNLGGLFPTAYGWFGESGFTQPIAFTMAWGLLFSTTATLFVLPVLLSFMHSAQILFSGYTIKKNILNFKNKKEPEVVASH